MAQGIRYLQSVLNATAEGTVTIVLVPAGGSPAG
jgi:hypothetical protein